MANIINIALGFNFNKGVMNAVVGSVGNLKTAVVGAGNAVSNLNIKMSTLQRVQGFAALGNVVNNVTGAIKGMYNEIKNVFGYIDDYAAKGDKIAKTSRLVGLSVKEYQAFGSAVQHAGMNVEEMDKAFVKFNINFSKAKSGDKNSIKMFDAILGGRSVKDFSNKTDLLAAIADGYEKLGSAEQKAFVSQELFGKSGVKISELFKDGGDALKKYVSDFKASFDENSAKSAEDFKDISQAASESFEKIKASIAVGLFPVVEDILGFVKDFFESKDADNLKKQISEIAKPIAEVIKSVLPKIPEILNNVMILLDIIGPNASAIVVGFAAALPFLVSIGAGLGAVASVISGPILVGIGLAVAAVKLWSGVIIDIYNNWDMLTSFIVDDVWGAIKHFGKKVVAIGEWIWDGFKSVFIDPWIAFFSSLPSAISDLWNGAKKVLKDLGSMIYDSIFGSISKAFDAAKSFLKGIPGLGKLFGGDAVSVAEGSSGMSTLGASAAQAVQESRTTVTNRFAVDFKNMPRGVVVTPPEHGDFDYSRGYVLGGI